MIPKKICEEFNKQMNREFFSAYLYQAMGAAMAESGMCGFAHWFGVQAREELEHAIGFCRHILDRGGKAEFEAIEKPALGSRRPIDLFADALEQERMVSAYIDRLYRLAKDECDSPAEVFLQWYITEQVEEEKSAQEVIGLLELAGDNAAAIIAANKALSKREYKPQNIS